MTRLDTAALHTWLTDALNQLQPNTGDGRTIAAIADDFDTYAALFDIDGWLRTQAADQLHRPGHHLEPVALLEHPDLRIAVDDLHTWLTARAANTGHETRAKTYAAVAAELPRFTLAPDPFPHGDDTAGWAPPGPRWWPHRLQLAAAWARDLIR